MVTVLLAASTGPLWSTRGPAALAWAEGVSAAGSRPGCQRTSAVGSGRGVLQRGATAEEQRGDEHET